MTIITCTELRRNTRKWVDYVATAKETIGITFYGKVITHLQPPSEEEKNAVLNPRKKSSQVIFGGAPKVRMTGSCAPSAWNHHFAFLSHHSRKFGLIRRHPTPW